MAQSLPRLKEAAKVFIDIIDEATDGTQDGQIGSGRRIGIVSFSSIAAQDTGLITSVADLKAAVYTLSADGSNNHADAFTAQHNGICSGTLTVNESISYTDTEGNIVTFDNP